MMRRTWVVLVGIGVVALGLVPGTGAGAVAALDGSFVASTWDTPAKGVHVYDTSAISGMVNAVTAREPTDNASCDLYVTTYTITWVAKAPHVLTSVLTEDDSFGLSWERLDTTTWSLLPDAYVESHKAPVVRHWYVKGTHRSDPQLCPRDTRTTNHVEISVDGTATKPIPQTFVASPPRSHLAMTWDHPSTFTTVGPERVTATPQSVYTEWETPIGDCQALFTESWWTFEAVGDARIIAVGQRQPGGPVVYQNGDVASIGGGYTSHEYFLTGTTQKSDLCPADQLSADHIEIYTDAIRG
jgi:hypothetical protein